VVLGSISIGTPIGHRAIVLEEGTAPVRMIGNGQEQSLEVFLQATASGADCRRLMTTVQAAAVCPKPPLEKRSKGKTAMSLNNPQAAAAMQPSLGPHIHQRQRD